MNLTYLEHGNSYKKDANHNCEQQNDDGFWQPVPWLGVRIVWQQQESRTQNVTEAAHSWTEWHNSILAPPKYHAHLVGACTWCPVDTNHRLPENTIVLTTVGHAQARPNNQLTVYF